MARYFFDFSEGEAVLEDCEGNELQDLDAAVRLARSCFIETIHEHLRRGVSPCSRRLTVRERGGPVVLALGFDDVVKRP